MVLKKKIHIFVILVKFGADSIYQIKIPENRQKSDFWIKTRQPNPKFDKDHKNLIHFIMGSPFPEILATSGDFRKNFTSFCKKLPTINKSIRIFTFSSASSSPHLHLIVFKLIVFPSPSSSRLSSPHRLQADHLPLAVFKLVIFTSPSSSWSSSPHRLQAGHLPLTVFKLVVFASPSSSLSSSPHSLQAVRLRLKVFAWSSPSHRRRRGTSPCRDRRRCSAPWLITHGVGQSPCALGRGRQCTSRDFPLSMRWWSTWGVHSRKGLHRQVSPDLSSDKFPFHRIPLKRCVATVVEQPTGCNGLAANGGQQTTST
ncbi:hypothetical protein OUZ56_013349 [Daphnia magna]|uniref:Uncharacterized protein n=1 Tax=Daphnia magna TaxID=35525 RepID=A0ABQ9Z5L2_9CRUS|nr:hypothetical protein OUZ56_013349 [Daphnia magna]